LDHSPDEIGSVAIKLFANIFQKQKFYSKEGLKSNEYEAIDRIET